MPKSKQELRLATTYRQAAVIAEPLQVSAHARESLRKLLNDSDDCSILEHENRTAIGTLRFSAILDDRQIDARMRIPQRHFRQRTRQRQLRTGDFVTALRVGRFGGVIGGGGTAHGAIHREENHILADSPPHLPARSMGSSLVS